MSMSDRILLAFVVSIFGGALALAVVAAAEVITSVIG